MMLIFDMIVKSAAGRVVGAVIAGVLALKLYGLSEQHKGAVKEAAKVEKRGDANAQKAAVARRAVERVPDQRLCDARCRD
jgi:ferritin-like protein